MNVLPAKSIRSTLADIEVLALVLTHPEVPLTGAVIHAVESWFPDIEIDYPIAQMRFTEDERRELVLSVASDLKSSTAKALEKAECELLDEAAFREWIDEIDGLWRELARAMAPEMNALFRQRVGAMAEVSRETRARAFKSAIERGAGPERVLEFAEYAKENRLVRTALRRLGVDPDLI